MGLFKKKPEEIREYQVSDKHFKLRVAAFFLFLAIGLGCIAYFFYGMVTKDPGWITVETELPELDNTFILNYNIGQGELSAADEYRAVTDVYSREGMRAYRLLDVYREYEGVTNLFRINRSPNQELKIDPVLYGILSQMEEFGGRMLYLAPLRSSYENLFLSQNEVEAKLSDPRHNKELAEYFEELLTYVLDPSMISLELLGENRVKLTVSPTYAAYAEENGIEEFVDASLFANAFIVDHVAQSLVDCGYTLGNITSIDGYTRNMDASGTEYVFNIFDRVEDGLCAAAVMKYRKASSFVFFKNYPMSTREGNAYFGYSDGSYATKYIDPQTGLCKSAVDNMVVYSEKAGCGEIALKMAEIYAADALDEEKLNALREGNLFAVWTEGQTILYNQKDLTLAELYKDQTLSYESKFAE